MTVSKMRHIMFLFFLGLLFLALDVYANTGIDYPHDYKNDTNIIGEYQYYNIKTFYGATCTYKQLGHVDISDAEVSTGESTTSDSSLSDNASSDNTLTDSTSTGGYSSAEFVDDVFFDGFRIDLFNDVIGLILIIIVCIMLSKYKSFFRLSLILSLVALLIKGILTILPFILNGMTLCNMALGVGTSYIVATIVTVFFGIKGFLSLIQDSCCRDERVWINTTWLVSVVLTVLIYLLTWLDLMGLAYFFTGVLIIDTLIFGNILKRVDEFAARNCKA